MFGNKKIKKPWGYIEELASGKNWRVDKITINPGESDNLHAQPSCRHSCYVEQGVGRVHAGPRADLLTNYLVEADREFVINNDWLHRYENLGRRPLVIIQSSYGKFDLKELTSEL